MKTVLFAAELGEGLGHVAPLAAIARRMVENRSDVRPVFAVKNAVQGRAILGDDAYPMLPAPWLHRFNDVTSHSSSYAELLMGFGFARERDLVQAVATWDDLFALLKPDLMIADHSPIACLAARGRMPTMVIGNGYTAPPAHMPLYPALRAGMGPPTTQKAMLELANSVLSGRGQSPLNALPELLMGDRRAVFTVPHLDPYGAIRQERLFGAYESGLVPSPCPDDPHIFIYAGESSGYLDVIARSVIGSGFDASSYFGGVQTPTTQFLENRGMRVFERPPPLADVLAKASLIISHGGAGLSLAGLLVGRPQLIIPIHAESQLTAGKIEALGAGVVVEQNIKEELGTAIRQVHEIRHYRERAGLIAAELAAIGLPKDAIGEAAGLAQSLL